jgi:hypothetical protein
MNTATRLITSWGAVPQKPVRRRHPDPELVHQYHEAQHLGRRDALCALDLVSIGFSMESRQVQSVFAEVDTHLREELRLREIAAHQVGVEDAGHIQARLMCARQIEKLRRDPLGLCRDLDNKQVQMDRRNRPPA